MFKECGRRTDDGRTDDGRRRPTYPISSPLNHTDAMLRILHFFDVSCLSAPVAD